MYERPTIRPTARREDGACQTDEIAPTSVTAEFGGYFVCRGSSRLSRIFRLAEWGTA